MRRRDDSELMMHADGELDEHTAREVEDDIVRDTEARAKVTAVGQLGELVRGHLELSADAVPEARVGAMWREIEKRIAAARTDESARADEPARADDAAQSASVWRRISVFFDRYRGHMITGVVSAGVVAMLALMFRPSGPLGGGAGTEREPIPTQPAAYRPAQIESLDTPGGSPAVFHLHDKDSNATVIWVTAADTVEGI
jgi:anti-sigma factor RsiW